jgi:hypothetical protein
MRILQAEGQSNLSEVLMIVCLHVLPEVPSGGDAL